MTVAGAAAMNVLLLLMLVVGVLAIAVAAYLATLVGWLKRSGK